ncbi:hypothetical protein YSY43_41210 [Paenibacillus sp. YSY-4.3]
MNWKKYLALIWIVGLLLVQFPPAANAEELWGASGESELNTVLNADWSEHAVPGQWLVSYKASAMLRLVPEESFTLRHEDSDQLELIEVKPNEEEEILEELLNDPSVTYIEPNYIYRAASDVQLKEGRDPLYEQQWGHIAVQAAEAWSRISGMNVPDSREIIVAVLDSGIDTDHPDLQGRFLKGYNAIEDSEQVEDDFGHGTAVSGIINAVYANDIGVTGIAGRYPVRILPIKVLDQYGNGSTFSVIRGIEKAIEDGADVINLSLSGNGNSYLLQEAVRKAVDHGIIVVAAAGNHADHTSGYYPAMYPETIAVSAVTETGSFAAFSNYGTPIDLTAPGERILTTMPFGDFEYHDGTSLAAPYVSGAAALMKLARPDWGVQEIRTALEQSAKDLGDPGYDIYFGHGLLQIDSALSLAEEPGIDPQLRLLKPNMLEQVKGKVDFEVRLPKGGTSLAMTDSQGLLIPLDALQVRETERIAAFSLNTENWADGMRSWSLQAFSATGEPVGTRLDISLLISNTTAMGIPVTVLDPEGTPVHGAKIQLLRQVEKSAWMGDPFEAVFSMYSNDQGLAFFPEALLLATERYIVKASFSDDRNGLEYTAVQEILNRGAPLLFDSRQQSDAALSISFSQPSSDTASSFLAAAKEGKFTVVPIAYGQELWDLAYRLEAGKEGMGKLLLPTGAYSAFAAYSSLEGSYVARRELNISVDHERGRPIEVQFDIDLSRPMKYSLPNWADKAELYLESKAEGLEQPIMLQDSQPLWLDRYSAAVSIVKLTQLSEGSEWEYSLAPHDSVIQAGQNHSLVIPGQAILSKAMEPKVKGGFSVRPGETLDIAYSLSLGGQLAISEIYQDGEEIYPSIVLLDRKGREVSRSELDYGSIWKVPAHIPKGTYSLYVDASRLPLPFSGPSEMKLYELRVGEGKATAISVISHDSLYSLLCELIVVDSRTGEELYSGMVFAEKEAVFEVLGLSPRASYVLKIRGLTSDRTPFYTESILKPETGDRVTIDLAADQSGMRLVSFRLQAGQFFDLSKDGVNVTSIAAEQDGTYMAWLGSGSYTMTLVQRSGERPYYFKRDIKIDKNTTTLHTDPDYSSMLQVDWQSPYRDEDDQIGIKDRINPIFSEHFLFPAKPGKQLYVSQGELEFQLLDVESAGQVKFVHVLDARPQQSRGVIKFRTDHSYAARLSAQNSKGQEMNGKVQVKDSFGNRLIGLLQVTYENWNAVKDPVFLSVDPLTGPELVIAEDMTHAAFRKLGEQHIRPILRLWQDGRLVAEQQGTWEEFKLKLPDGLRKGRYNLVWSVEGPVLLSTETTVRLNQ